MKTLTNLPPDSSKKWHEIIFNLQQSLENKDKELAHINAELANERIKNAYLLEQFRLARQQRFAPRTEKNIFQADLFDKAGIESEAVEEPQQSIDIKSHPRKKHPVRKPLPLDLPREVITHDINVEEKSCACGVELSRIGEEITEQLKFIPATLSVIRHVRYKYACKLCQENVRIAPMPLLLLPKTNATPELIAHTIISKYADHIPLYRQAKIWNRVDIDLPRSTLCSWLINVADQCEPLVILLHKNLIEDDYLQGDESPVQVLNEPGRANTSKSYLWVYRGGGKQPSVVFDYQQTRSGYHAQTFLAGFKGYLQTDAYSGYSFTEKDKNIIHLGCMAHARRPFAQLAKLVKKEGLATKAIIFFKDLYAIEAYARDNNLSEQQRYELRHEKAPPILEKFKSWLHHHLTKVPKQHTMGKAIYYVLNH